MLVETSLYLPTLLLIVIMLAEHFLGRAIQGHGRSFFILRGEILQVCSEILLFRLKKNTRTQSNEDCACTRRLWVQLSVHSKGWGRKQREEEKLLGSNPNSFIMEISGVGEISQIFVLPNNLLWSSNFFWYILWETFLSENVEGNVHIQSTMYSRTSPPNNYL